MPTGAYKRAETRLGTMIKCPSCGEENPPKFRLCGYCGTPLAAAPAPLPVREVRKTVTIVFCDLKGSTALGERLDAEALHEVKERYFNAMAAEIAAPWRQDREVHRRRDHGGVRPAARPRGRRAARGARRGRHAGGAGAREPGPDARATASTLANRTGVNTGEVVANDDPAADQKLATGDAVNVAARLEQAAPENQIYLGDVTYRLVRDAVEVEAVEPLELKGKARARGRLPAGRGARPRRQRCAAATPPIVGRDDEFAAIDAALPRGRRRARGAHGHGDRRRRRRQIAPRAGGHDAHRRRRHACCAAAACPMATASRSGRCAGWSASAADIRDDDKPERRRPSCWPRRRSRTSSIAWRRRPG